MNVAAQTGAVTNGFGKVRLGTFAVEGTAEVSVEVGGCEVQLE